MSECVVRMEIPVNCDKCDLRNGCKLYVDYSWSLSDCFPTRPKPNPLDKGCLIICSLPEGHGRLVDAEEIYKKSEAFCNQCRQGEHDCEKCNYIVAQGYMYKSPTIVPAERKDNGETC